MSSDDLIEIEYDHKADVPDSFGAWLLGIGGEEFWLPKSKCKIDEDAKTISVPRQLVEKKGLDPYV